MHDVGLRQIWAQDRFDELRRAAQRPLARPGRASVRPEAADIELRLCKPVDDPALERLAALAEKPLPAGRMVVALVDGQLVAAQPLAGGPALADPFVRTAHLVRLLELRVAQLRPRAPHGRAFRLLHRHA